MRRRNGQEPHPALIKQSASKSITDEIEGNIGRDAHLHEAESATPNGMRRSTDTDLFDQLCKTQTEIDILTLWQDYSRAEIAEQLDLSVHDVRKAMNKIRNRAEKLGLAPLTRKSA
jgi:DNA-directed RNA polymerase specialized sigma24 family protein